MKLLSWIALICILLYGCHAVNRPTRHSVFEFVDFTYDDVFSSCFSIKFTQGDTAYIKQYFVGSLSDSLKENGLYFALLNKSEKHQLDSLVSAIDFSTLDSNYGDFSQDGLTYQIYFRLDSVEKMVYVHGVAGPDKLHALGIWISEMKKRLKLVPMDLAISFKSEKGILPPRVEAPDTKFTPPKIR